MKKTKICLGCNASFVPTKKNENYCPECGGNRVHPETERHEGIIKGGKR